MRRVLVTGGGSGIGRAIARAFAADGAAVTISGRRADALAETARGHDMTCVAADVTREDDVARLFDRPFDVVVANAGAGRVGKVAAMSLEDWRFTVEVNLTGTFLTFREGLRGMGPGGRLIAVASTAGLMGQANVAAYSAAKHGVIGLVRSLAHEVARDGITCNAICPYYTDTPMARAGIDGYARRFGVSETEAEAKIAERNPAGRLITPDEVASAALYLASPGAAMINGHALSMSGGLV